MIYTKETTCGLLEVEFSLSESYAHVYKTFKVWLNGIKRNIITFRKFVDIEGEPSILTQSTYFFNTYFLKGKNKWRVDEINRGVHEYLVKNGFRVSD